MFRPKAILVFVVFFGFSAFLLIVGFNWYNRQRGQVERIDLTEIPESPSRNLPQTNGPASGGFANPVLENRLAGDKHSLGSLSPEEQLKAVDELAVDGSEVAVRDLALFIHGLPHGDFREEAVRRASVITNRDSLPAILELLKTSQDPGVIRIGQEVFARLADANSFQNLVHIYDSSTDAKLRERFEQTVAGFESEKAVPLLASIVSDVNVSATDGMVRASARALRIIGTPPAVDVLINRLRTDQNADSRSVISAELQKVRNPLSKEILRDAALRSSQFAADSFVRGVAIGALVNYPSAETQETLELLKSDTDPYVALAATDALAWIQKRATIKAQ